MQLKRQYSAREGAALLGYASANPILSAIRDGRLAAERSRERGRNGRNTSSWKIAGEALRQLAVSEGVSLHVDGKVYNPVDGGELLSIAQAAEAVGTDAETIYAAIQTGELPAHQPGEHWQGSESSEPLSNVARIVPLRAPDAPIAPAPGLVTIPIEHYAALVAARAELEFMRANFTFTWHGGGAQSHGKPLSEVAGKDSGPGRGSIVAEPTPATPGRRRAGRKPT